MQNRTRLPIIALVTTTAACICTAWAAPLVEFSCVERLGREWKAVPVTYPVSFEPGHVLETDVRLVNRDGDAVACQFTRVQRHDDGSIATARLVFEARLPANGSYAYELRAGAPSASPTVTVSREPEGMTLDTGAFAVRLPPEGEFTFPEPLRFGSDHAAMVRAYGRQAAEGLAPGPLQGFRLHDGHWVGGSYFSAADPGEAPLALGYACRITEHGALFTEATVEYRFDGDRYYRFVIRLAPGDTAAWIDEQFDLREVGRTRGWRQLAPNDPRVVFSLSGDPRQAGWRPDHVFWERQPYGSGVRPENTEIEKLLGERPGFDFSPAAFGSHALRYEAEHAGPVAGLEPWAVFGNFVFYAGLVQAAQVQALDAPPFVGVMPVHAGNWRNDGPYSFKWLTTHAEGDVAWHLPLMAQVHPNTSVHTGEYDPELPYTFGRRQWVLFGGPLRSLTELHEFRRYDGYINLDDYKDWILDWPADPDVTYPRMFVERDDLERLEPVLAAGDITPAPAATIREWLYVEDSPRRAAALYNRLSVDRGFWNSALGQINAGLNYWFPLWRQGHATSQWITQVEELLSSRHLSDEQHRTLRIQLAAMASLAAEPDYGPRGSMVHLGNPNMAIVRFMPLLYAATLIPDHPRAEHWLSTIARFVEYKLFSNTGPDGGWSELFTYYDASAPTLVHAANILDRLGLLSPAARGLVIDLAAQPLYFQAPVDPRIGHRAVPNWGHEGRGINFGAWLPGAQLAAAVNPSLAAGLHWGWAQSGFPLGSHDSGFTTRCLAYIAGTDMTAAAVPTDELRSRWIPGLGVAMRAHAGDPDETFLAYRQGYFISHCDDNQGDFVLFGRGAPLVDMSLFAYPLHQHEPYRELNAQFGWYSYPRLAPQDVASDMHEGANNRNLIGAWNASSAVHAHAFDPSVDYLRGHADYPPHRWSRQIMFLKGRTAGGPNYFVFRDSFDVLPGTEAELKPYWWNIRTVGPSEHVRPVDGGLDYTSPYGPRLLVRFPLLNRPAVETRQASREGRGFDKETFSISAVGPVDAGRDTLAVLYPAADDEAPPRIDAPADGVLRIDTADGTDWIFVDRQPFEFAADQVAFHGRAGAVRIRDEVVHLIVAEGPGEIRYRGVTLRSDGPATRIVPRAEADAQRLFDVPAPDYTIRFTPPAGEALEPAPGVRRIETETGFALAFDSEQPLAFADGEAWFHGRRGGIVVNTMDDTVRLVVIDGAGAGHGAAAVWNATGPYDFTFHHDRVTGRHDGLGRVVNMTVPAGLDRYATLVVNGVPHLPGSSVTTDPAVAGRAGGELTASGQPVLVIPLLEGEHDIEVRNLEQPPIFRKWQAW